MTTELRRTFNEDEGNYDKYRPGYPAELFNDIAAYSQIKAGSKLLEIGTGTGQATLPFLQRDCRVTGVELGDKLAAFVAEKYKDYPNFSVLQADFMHCPLEENQYDLIFSATAFHWLPQEEAYARIMKLLKKGGTVALFWNHPFPNREDDPSNVASRNVYDRFRPSNKKIAEFGEKDCDVRRQALQKAGFGRVESRLYRRVRTLSGDEYIHLLNTYSDHRALEKNLKEQFEIEMKKAIDEVGGSIRIYDTVDLYLATKRDGNV